ncbi:recombinase family protein [Fictibacillus sp. S7]|uniref:recombinase family protein n=1 Tax=Fictibacillus sp. S7 TaxID=2212476 RepID=UPI001013A3A9|nr:recombinase family protein [Fictibacillus sp. S7]RXZ02400.1 site-specific recombinase [Fictibacillus sp. S7]
MKRVWCLYRVSTKQQVNTDDDIPIQRNACCQFVEQQSDWTITNELYERGVSGWKKRVEDRDALNTIREAAVAKKFDVLLVFMFDRLGRREDETPLIVNFLNENGVEVWSVQEGKKKMDSHVDKLINYISFWQSSGESLKTSIRVRESKKQLSQQGYFQGGRPPYGYELYATDQIHWKNPERKIKELRPDKYESNIVNIIYDLYVNKNFGKRRIAGYLNENLFKTREGKKFSVSTIHRILTNPIYVGYRRYKSFDFEEGSTQSYNKGLHIISSELFERAQQIKEAKNRILKKQDKTNIPTKGRLLFSGIAKCMYCNSKLTAHYLYRKSKRKNGEEYKTIIYRYTCPLNTGHDSKHEQYVWGAVKYDKIILDEVKHVLSFFDLVEFIDNDIGIKGKLLQTKEKSLKNLIKEKSELQEQLQSLNMEIVSALSGNSDFTPKQLSKAISGIEEKLQEKSSEIEYLKKSVKQLKQDIREDDGSLDQILTNWESLFDNADHDRKKVLLSNLIDTIYLGKNKVSIKFNIYLEEIINHYKESCKQI